MHAKMRKRQLNSNNNSKIVAKEASWPSSGNKTQSNAKIHNHFHHYQGHGQGQAPQVRSWMVVNNEGKCETVEVGKHAIMRRAGLPARDLRMLEPALSYPSTILGRERAVVFNVEHIKAIITASEILLLNSPHPAVAPFAQLLRRRLSASQENGTPNADMDAAFRSHPRNDELSQNYPAIKDVGNTGTPKVLPFEFRALEACLEESCNCLELETTTLEQEAYPALDELTTTISTLNLERVRQIKSRLVAISGRIQKVRDELEQLLDDDGDMAEMYLTNKILQQQLEEKSSVTSDRNKEELLNAHQTVPDESEPLEVLDGYAIDAVSSSQSDEDNTPKHFDVEELEMLLEAYFVQIDGTLNKLSSLRQYVDNTEDYINIMLDDKQNQLLRMGVLLSTVNLLINCAIVVVGIFGMNITIQLFDDAHAGLLQFAWTVAGCVIGCCILYTSALAWYKHRRLLD